MSDTKVVIVVPVYKGSMNEFEEVSLIQLFRVLSHFDIVFVGPEKCKDFYLSRYDARYEVFDDRCWVDTASYSHLLMDIDFYMRFIRYEYMLIYHLDAFVFSDRLLEFCEKGYDYIGAPLKGVGWKKYHIGNGGLSLRNIQSSIRVVKEKDLILQDPEAKDVLIDNEDTFFGFCGYSSRLNFKVPSIFEAAEFSAELDVGHAIRNIGSRGLPFGCHAWYQLNYQIWKPAIEKHGYSLPEIDDENNRDEMERERKKRLQLFLYYILRHSDENKLGYYREKLKLDACRTTYIRGAGKYGKSALKLAKALRLKVLGFIDKEASGYINGIKVFDLSKLEEDKDAFIIIGSIRYKDDFKTELTKMGKAESVDFGAYSDYIAYLRKIVVEEYPGIAGITCKFVGE